MDPRGHLRPALAGRRGQRVSMRASSGPTTSWAAPRTRFSRSLLLVVAGLLAFAVRRWRVEVREQDARSKAESRYRALVERMPAVLYTWIHVSPPGPRAVPFVGPQVEAILGFTAEEWQADPELWIRQIHPDDRERVLRGLGTRRSHGRAVRHRVPASEGGRHRGLDPSTRPVVVERDTRGRPRLVQGFMYDHHAAAAWPKRPPGDRGAVPDPGGAGPRRDVHVDRAPRPARVRTPYVSPRSSNLLGYSPTSGRATPCCGARACTTMTGSASSKSGTWPWGFARLSAPSIG